MASLSRRDGMSSERAERLWLTHVQSSLVHTSGQPRMFVFYEDLISDWVPELRRMAAFIGRPQGDEDPRVHAWVGEFIERELCHHRMSIEDLADDERISFATKSLYLALRGYAPRDTPVDDVFGQDRADRIVQKTLDVLAVQAIETSDRQTRMAAEGDTLARENRAQVATLAALNADRNRLAAEASVLSEKALALSAECHALRVREERLRQSMANLESDLQSVTAERDDQARESEAALRALQEIHASCAWTLVTFSRNVMVGLLPARTGRRRLFDSVMRRMAQRADVWRRTA